MSEGKLIIMCGPAGCGKSTWAREYIKQHENVEWVSRDEIRFSVLKEGEHYFSHEDEVYQIFCNTISNYLSLGKSVIADATHLNEKARKKLIDSLSYPITGEDIIIIYFQIPLHIVLAQNAQRTGRRLVPVKTIREMYYGQTDPHNDQMEYGQIITVEGND